jgi:hypothetical protein
MREILTSKLWLGNAGDVRNVERIMQAGVSAVVDLAAEQPMPTLPQSLLYCHFPVFDGQQASATILSTAIETVVLLLEKQIPTLVYCGAGMSRSPAIVAGALAVFQGGSPDDHLREIAIGQPHDVSGQLWQDVRTVCAEITRTNHP